MKKVSGQKHLYRRGKDGTFYFRRYIPEKYRHAFEGKYEDVTSLETNNISEARHRLLAKETLFDSKLNRASQQLSSPEGISYLPDFDEISLEVRTYFTERQKRTYTEHLLDPALHDQAKERIINAEAFIADTERSISLGSNGYTLSAVWTAESLIEKLNWDIQTGTAHYRKLIQLVSFAQIEAAKREIQEISGNPSQVIDQRFSTELILADANTKQDKANNHPIPLLDLFDAYVDERQPRISTTRSWRRLLISFIQFIGHDNAKAIEPDDIILWKDHLLSNSGKNLSANTVNNAYLAALRTTLNWGVENRKITANPASSVRARKQSQSTTRSKGLTDEEASLILRSTLKQSQSKITAERAFARRWVPWLCAYSGARVNEITQLRREDITNSNNIWVMNLTPEAGQIKNNQARLIPIHPHIIDQGFITVIEDKEGPLFYDVSRRSNITAENTQAKKAGEYLAKWVRSIGVTDKRVWPNHGWRHRFKTLARRVGMSPETRDAIQGHASRTEGEAYGDIEIDVKYEAICLLPKYEI